MTLVVITYAGHEPHDRARAVVRDLAKRSGAQVTHLTISDVPLDGTQSGGRRPSAVQTSAEAYLRGAAFVLDDAYLLQPFVEALREVRRFDVLFVDPPAKQFRGLVRFDDGGVHVQLVQGGNPYRYAVTLEPGIRTLPVLPLRQPQPSTSRNPGNRTTSEYRGSAGVWLVVGATATAMLVFVLLRAAALRRARSMR